MSFVPSFKIGQIVTHGELRSEFKCGNMGGMRPSKATNCLVLISDHTKGLYEDKWFGDVLHYTGMGKHGDQVLKGNANKTLAESRNNGISVHLFEVLIKKQYIYLGEVILCSDPYIEVQKDVDGILRKVWMFQVHACESSLIIDERTYLKYVEQQKRKAKKLSLENLKERAMERGTRAATNRSITSKIYVRDQYIIEYAKRRANGKCQLCENPAPFYTTDGSPYLETHHIVWLSAGGADSIENTVALCPNCHRKMHTLNRSADVAKLLKAAKET